MVEHPYEQLSRRERQIMDVVYRLERVAVADVRERLPDPPSYSAVRAMLGKLEAKGYLVHEEEGPRYVYMATTPRDEAREGALTRVVRTFFEGSAVKAAAAMLDLGESGLTEADLDELEERIHEARKRGR